MMLVRLDHVASRIVNANHGGKGDAMKYVATTRNVAVAGAHFVLGADWLTELKLVSHDA